MSDELLDPRVVQAAIDAGVDAEALDWHVEALHGWESHDPGYVEKGLAGAAQCLLHGGTRDTCRPEED